MLSAVLCLVCVSIGSASVMQYAVCCTVSASMCISWVCMCCAVCCTISAGMFVVVSVLVCVSVGSVCVCVVQCLLVCVSVGRAHHLSRN